jgi:hypothetical protein
MLQHEDLAIQARLPDGLFENACALTEVAASSTRHSPSWQMPKP